MDSPKIRLLIEMGTNKLKEGLNKMRAMVDTGVGQAKAKLETIEAPAIKTGGFMNSLSVLKVAALAAGVAIAAALGSSISTAMEGSAQKVSFEVLGGKDKGDQLYGALTKFAQDSIFGNEVYKDAQTMLGFGIAIDTVLPRIKQLGDLSMGNAQKLESLSLVFAQTTAAGKLMGQDALQYINAGWNPLQEMVKMTGKSLTYWKEQMEDGAITAAMVGKALDHATGPMGSFYKMTEKIGDTTYGKWQAFKGQLEGIALQLGTALLPVAGKVIDYLAHLADAIGPLIVTMQPVFDALGTGFDYLVLVIGGVSSALQVAGGWIMQNKDWLMALGGAVLAGAAAYKIFQAWQVLSYMWMMRELIAKALLVTVTGGLATATAFLNAVFLASPIGWIVLGVAALTAGIIYAWKKFDWFRGAVYGAWEVLKVFGSMLYELTIGQIKRLIEGLGGLGSALMKLFGGDFSGAWEDAKEAAGKLSGVDTIKAVIEDGKQIGGAWKKGYADGIEDFQHSQLKEMTKEDYTSYYNKLGKSMGESFRDGVLDAMAKLPAMMASTMMLGTAGVFAPVQAAASAVMSRQGLNPDKVAAGGAGTKTPVAAKDTSDKVTGSAGQTRNITIAFGSYIKGDVISQTTAIKNMSKEELDRWLREHFLRLLQDVEQGYA